MRIASFALWLILIPAEAAAQSKRKPEPPWPWFDHRIALVQAGGVGTGSVETARSDADFDALGLWFALSYDYHLDRGIALGVSPRIGGLPESPDGQGVADFNVIGRLRFQAFRPKPSAWYIGVAAGPTKSLYGTPPEARAFKPKVRPGWGYNLGATAGIEILARSGWGACFELSLVRHTFSDHWTYELTSDGSRLEEDRRYVLYEAIVSIGVLRGL